MNITSKPSIRIYEKVGKRLAVETTRPDWLQISLDRPGTNYRDTVSMTHTEALQLAAALLEVVGAYEDEAKRWERTPVGE